MATLPLALRDGDHGFNIIEKLTTEIICTVIRHLDPKSIKSLSVTNREFVRLTSTEIFRHGIKVNRLQSDLDQAIKFFTAQTPQTLATIRSISLTFQYDSPDMYETTCWKLDLSQLSDLFSLLPGLRNVTVDGIPCCVISQPASEQRRFPNVNRVILGDVNGPILELFPNAETPILTSNDSSEVPKSSTVRGSHHLDVPNRMEHDEAEVTRLASLKRYGITKALSLQNTDLIWYYLRSQLVSWAYSSMELEYWDICCLYLSWFPNLKELAFWNYEAFDGEAEFEVFKYLFNWCLKLKRVWIGHDGKFVEVVRSSQGGVEKLVEGMVMG